MELPGISFGGPVPSNEGAYREVGAAAERLGGAASQGLYALHQEIVKGQSADAANTLASGLAALKTGLRSKKAFDPGELKQIVGDEAFEKIPESVRNRPPDPVLNEKGEQQTDDRGFPLQKPGAIPAWQAAPYVFDKSAQDLMDRAAGRITAGGGWQERFRQAAMGDVIRHRAEMAAEWAQQAGQHVAGERVRQTMEAANAGNFELAHALADSSLEALGEEGQARLQGAVQTAQVVRPIEDALIQFRSDPASPDAHAKLVEAAKALADDSRTGILEPAKRATLDGQVRAALDQAEKGQKTHEAAGLALAVIQANPDPMHPYTMNPQAAQAALAKLFQPGGRFADRPELYFETASLLSKQVSDQNAAAKAGFDQVAGVAIGQYLGMDDRGAPHPRYANVSPEVRAALQAQGKDGQDLLRQMLNWDREADRAAREARNLPSDAEEGRAFRIERSIALQPGAWRAMSGADQMAVMAGLKPIPGEPDAPAVAISAKDVPTLSRKIADLSAPVGPVFVTDPAKIALEEATKAFPVLKNPKNSNARARAALQGLSDYLSTYITGEKNRTGKEPDQAAVRAEAQKRMQLVEVRDTFLGIPAGTKKITRQEAEQQGVDYANPDAPPPPPPSPAPGVEFHGKTLRTQADVERERARLTDLLDDKRWGDDAKERLRELAQTEAQVQALSRPPAPAPAAPVRKTIQGKTYENRGGGPDDWYEVR